MEFIKKKIILIFLFFVSYNSYAQNPLQLWYNHPAMTWEGTLPLGNGRLGMTPDGGVEKEHVVLNDISLWSGSPQDANNYDAHKYLPKIRELLFEGKNEEAQKLVDQHFVCLGPGSGGPQWGCFQTLGNIDIDFTYPGSKTTKVNYKNYKRSLSLDSAIATNTYEVDGVKYKKEYFTSFGTDVDIIRITTNKLRQINCSIEISRSERAKVSTKNNILQMEGQLDNGTDGKGMQYLAKVKAVAKGGTQYTKGNRLIVKNANELIIYISEKTNYKNPTFRKDVDELMAKAISTPYKKEKRQHIETFQKLYKRVYVNLGPNNKNNIPTDQRLIEFQKDPKADNGMAVLFYQFGRYLSISSTRVGLLPPNLQGLWANQIHTPWNGDYHLDVNVQMNHWGTDVSNLSELDLPLTALVKALVPNGEKTAKAYYNAEGWVAHVITNLWQFTEPGESASWGVTKCGSGWLCDNLWQHYAFTNDTSYLRKIYPILKGSALFYKSMLVRDPKTKWLVTSPSSSPENSFVMPDGHNVSICMGPTIDNQIIRELYDNVITATKIFNIDKSFRDTLEQQLTQLPPAGRISPDGRIMEWLEDYKESDLHHRHISHLYGLYPANQITPDSTPDLAEAARKTLEVRGDDGPGWSIAYKMLMWSRLYDGNRAYKLFINLMRPTTSTEINYGAGGGIYPNLFSAGPPFQIDANFGGCAAVAEMLLQSHAGYINLLPAIPDEWKPAGEVRGLKARGNFTVDFKWENGKITTFRIYSPTRQQVKVKINGIVKTVLSRKL
ncbi:glycoside hydrolase family 95 protein [Arachidicoccus ginsenosidivorans]